MAFTEETGSGRATVNKDSKAFHLALARRKEIFLLPVGLCCPRRAWKLPPFVSWLFNWGFCLLVFYACLFACLIYFCWKLDILIRVVATLGTGPPPSLPPRLVVTPLFVYEWLAYFNEATLLTHRLLPTLPMKKLRSNPRSQDLGRCHISFFLFFFLRCYISLGLLPFSFCPIFIPSGLTTHKVHECCSQKSHSLRVRSGLGIKKRMSTLLSLARTYEMGCTPHLLGPRPSCGHPQGQGLPSPPRWPGRGKSPSTTPWVFPSRTFPRLGQRKQDLLTHYNPLLECVSSHLLLLLTLLKTFFFPTDLCGPWSVNLWCTGKCHLGSAHCHPGSAVKWATSSSSLPLTICSCKDVLIASWSVAFNSALAHKLLYRLGLLWRDSSWGYCLLFLSLILSCKLADLRISLIFMESTLSFQLPFNTDFCFLFKKKYIYIYIFTYLLFIHTRS